MRERTRKNLVREVCVMSGASVEKRSRPWGERAKCR